MEDLQKAILDAWAYMSGWEVIAVVFAIAYLLLALKQNILCWYAALISTAIYTMLFWDASLLMESALQVYYLVMAVYGWYVWRNASSANKAPLPITTWGLKQHCITIGGVLIISYISGVLLQNNTSAAWPFVDSFTTWASVITTYMVAKKVLENWIYWFVIDSVCIFLYWDRELYLTAILFVAYIIIVVFGFMAWQKQHRLQQQSVLQPSEA